MTYKEYEQKKRECWEEFITMSPHKAFNFTFDRAFALGREKETITQEEIEDAAKDYAYDIDGSDWERQRARDGFVDGANFALGKQEKDAEGEEMLTCDRDVVRMLYDRADSVKVRQTLESLFGPKCLPDETKDETKEPKPAGPKFNLGDIVRFKYCCTPYRIDGFKMLDGAMLYHVGEVWAEESDLEPYTEPTNEGTRSFDTILKDSFSKERRLTIAAQMMQGLICAPLVPGVDPNPPAECLAQTAFRLADALLAEAEKGGSK